VEPNRFAPVSFSLTGKVGTSGAIGPARLTPAYSQSKLVFMALCEQGYLCDVCGKEVEEIIDSDLYLRYVLGEVPPERLHVLRERHIRCNPVIAQFIVDPRFEAVVCEGAFAKDKLDPKYVAEEEARITRGWRRLQDIPALGLATILEYPLPEVIAAWQAAGGEHTPSE
jgi:hypothetical protein